MTTDSQTCREGTAGQSVEEYSLFPLEPPPKRDRPRVFELDDDVRIVQLQSLVLARRARGTHGGEQTLGQRICVARRVNGNWINDPSISGVSEQSQNYAPYTSILYSFPFPGNRLFV